MLRSKVQRQEVLLQHFQNRWRREYLTALRESHKDGGVKDQAVKVGDIVLVHDDTSRSRWQLAIIEELIKGFTRAAKIRTKSGNTNRPIAKLYPLEVNSTSETTATTDNVIPDGQVSNDISTISCPSVPRATALKGRERIKDWTNTLSVALKDVKD